MFDAYFKQLSFNLVARRVVIVQHLTIDLSHNRLGPLLNDGVLDLGLLVPRELRVKG